VFSAIHARESNRPASPNDTLCELASPCSRSVFMWYWCFLHAALLHHREISVLLEGPVESGRVAGETRGELHPSVDVLSLPVGRASLS